MNNYTKGNWRVDATGSKLISVSSKDMAEVVAICGKPKWITERDTQLANAHLIAASPRLHKALIMAQAMLDTQVFSRHPDDAIANELKGIIEQALNAVEGSNMKKTDIIHGITCPSCGVFTPDALSTDNLLKARYDMYEALKEYSKLCLTKTKKGDCAIISLNSLDAVSRLVSQSIAKAEAK